MSNSDIEPDSGITHLSVTSLKTSKLIHNITGLLICAGIAVAAYVLDSQGIRLLMLNKTHSLMYAIFLLFSCFEGYFVLMLISMLQIAVRHGGESEISMLGSFNRVLAGFAIMIGIAYLFGRLDAFTAFFTMFGGKRKKEDFIDENNKAGDISREIGSFPVSQDTYR
ncbi:MAG: hypothetical protein FIA99_00940 [Ruminiclostridium sp.]|nr:hypothetical protein [Ruminiclostridium sp.]